MSFVVWVQTIQNSVMCSGLTVDGGNKLLRSGGTYIPISSVSYSRGLECYPTRSKYLKPITVSVSLRVPCFTSSSVFSHTSATIIPLCK